MLIFMRFLSKKAFYLMFRYISEHDLSKSNESLHYNKPLIKSETKTMMLFKFRQPYLKEILFYKQ